MSVSARRRFGVGPTSRWSQSTCLPAAVTHVTTRVPTDDVHASYRGYVCGVATPAPPPKPAAKTGMAFGGMGFAGMGGGGGGGNLMAELAKRQAAHAAPADPDTDSGPAPKANGGQGEDKKEEAAKNKTKRGWWGGQAGKYANRPRARATSFMLVEDGPG